MTPNQMLAVIERMDSQDKTLERIEAQVVKTNGRVTALERSNIAREAAAEAVARVEAARVQSRSWMPPAAVSCLVFVAGVAAERLL